jgi:hypothetical protein
VDLVQQNLLKVSVALPGDQPARIEELVDLLQKLKETLNYTDRLETPGATINYRIVSISRSSPYQIVLEPEIKTMPIQHVTHDVEPIEHVIETKAPEPIAAVHLGNVDPSAGFHRWAQSLALIQETGTAPEEFDSSAVEKLQDLLAPWVEGHFSVETNKQSITVKPEIRQTLTHIIGPNLVSYGSIRGRLEGINVHNVRHAYVYPMTGPAKMKVEFPGFLKADFVSAIDQYVSVSGKMLARKMDKYPHTLKADTIRVLTGGNMASEFIGLRGVAIPGQLAAEDFIRDLRDGN